MALYSRWVENRHRLSDMLGLAGLGTEVGGEAVSLTGPRGLCFNELDNKQLGSSLGDEENNVLPFLTYFFIASVSNQTLGLEIDQ